MPVWVQKCGYPVIFKTRFDWLLIPLSPWCQYPSFHPNGAMEAHHIAPHPIFTSYHVHWLSLEVELPGFCHRPEGIMEELVKAALSIVVICICRLWFIDMSSSGKGDSVYGDHTSTTEDDMSITRADIYQYGSLCSKLLLTSCLINPSGRWPESW